MNIKGTKQNSQNRLMPHIPEGQEPISRKKAFYNNLPQFYTYLCYIRPPRTIYIYIHFVLRIRD